MTTKNAKFTLRALKNECLYLNERVDNLIECASDDLDTLKRLTKEAEWTPSVVDRIKCYVDGTWNTIDALVEARDFLRDTKEALDAFKADYPGIEDLGIEDEGEDEEVSE